MAGPAAAGGVRAWSVFGTIGVRGLSGTISQLVAFNRVGKTVAGTAKAIAGTFTRIAKVAGTVTLALGGIAGVAVKSFSSFDDAMTQSLSIMQDVTEAQRKDMVQAARRVGRQTQFSATQAAEAYFFLASAGLDARQSISAMPAVADFAQAGMFDLARATDLLTDSQSALGLSSDDATENLENMKRVSDVLVRGNQLFNASVSQLAESIQNKLGARLRATNMSLEEGVALLGAFADQGVKGRRAGQRLNIVLRDLPQAALDSSEAFRDLGVRVFDASGELRPMADIIEDLEKALGDMSTQERIAALQTTGLNKRAADSLNILLGTSRQTREWKEALEEAGGAADEVASKQLTSLRTSFGLLGSAIKDALIQLGAEFAPTFRRMADSVRQFINEQNFSKLADQILRAAESIVTGIVRGIGNLGQTFVRFARTVQNMDAVLRGTFLGKLLGLEETERSKTAGEIRETKSRLADLRRELDAVTATGAEAERLQRILPVEGIGRDADEIRQEIRELEAFLVEKQQQLALMETPFQGAMGLFEGMTEFELNLPRGAGAGAGAIGDPAQQARDEMQRRARNIPPVELPFTAKVEVPGTGALPSLQQDLEEAGDKAADEAESSFASKGKMLGRSLVQGIISGSFSLEDFLKRALTTILTSALFGPGGVIGVLGIGSPARATVPIGEALVGGVIKGLHRTTPMLRTAMNRAFSARRTFHSGIRLAGAGGSGALNRVPQGTGVTPDRSGLINLDFRDFPAARTPMGRERDRMWQKWLRNQADIAMEEGFRFDPR